MKNILVAVIYHSGAGHTARQAAAVRRGVDQVAGTTSLFLTSKEAQKQWEALEQADAAMLVQDRDARHRHHNNAFVS